MTIPGIDVRYYIIGAAQSPMKGSTMRSIQQKTSHSVWECKYHIVWIPKYRKKVLYKELRQYLGEIFKNLAKQKECEIIEGHLMSDHVHMLIAPADKLGHPAEVSSDSL